MAHKEMEAFTASASTDLFGKAPFYCDRRPLANARGSAQKQRLNVASEEVFGHVTRDGFLTRHEHVRVAVSHAGGDLVADMQQLPDVRIEIRICRVVTHGAGVLLRTPIADLGGSGQPGGVDV